MYQCYHLFEIFMRSKVKIYTANTIDEKCNDFYVQLIDGDLSNIAY